MARGAARVPGVVARALPVADGGDGTLDVLLAAAPRGRVEEVRVAGPLGEPVLARLGWLAPGTAVVELAEAVGMRVLAGRPDPLRASSRGAGELLRAALERGARRLLVGVGGSASTDGGAGVWVALGARLLDAAGQPLADGGGALVDLATVDVTGLHPAVGRVPIEVACDVRVPLLGPRGAAAVFAPQKGATPAEVAVLEAGLARLATVAERVLGIDPRLRRRWGTGAAGGTAWGLAALCGARLRRGAPLVCRRVGLDAALAGAALVLTGEGRLDATTWAGKAPLEVAHRAARRGIPCVAVCGTVEGDPPGPFTAVLATSPGTPVSLGGGTGVSPEAAAARLVAAAARAVRTYLAPLTPPP